MMYVYASLPNERVKRISKENSIKQEFSLGSTPVSQERLKVKLFPIFAFRLC